MLLIQCYQFVVLRIPVQKDELDNLDLQWDHTTLTDQVLPICSCLLEAHTGMSCHAMMSSGLYCKAILSQIEPRGSMSPAGC